MDMKKRRDLQLAYIADEAIMEEQSRCRKILQKSRKPQCIKQRPIIKKHD